MARSARGNRPHDRRMAPRPVAISRRHLISGSLGLAGVVATGAGLGRPGGGFAELAGMAAAQETSAALKEPVAWSSDGGLLARTMRAQLDPARGPAALGYDDGGVGFAGKTPGPTLRLAPGDRLKLILENALGASTNLHFHGLHVSPLGHGDNVFVDVPSNSAFDYDFQIPADHPSGLFWYHPHFHHHANEQVNQGLAGAIVIAGGADEPPEVRAASVERLIVLQTANGIRVVNGQQQPEIAIEPGQWQRWRILNASANDFFNLRVVGHDLRRVGVDGNWIPDYGDLPDLKVLPLGPAERAEVLIQGGLAQRYEVRSLKTADRLRDGPVFDRDFVSDAAPPEDYDLLATLVSASTGAPEMAGATPQADLPPAVPARLQALNLRAAPQIIEREIRFQATERFLPIIDDRTFNVDRIDVTVEQEAVERWTIVNDTNFEFGWHPFHLHVNDFDVEQTSDGGLQPRFYQDTIPLPPRVGDAPGSVVFLTKFADFPGKFVYHCHFLAHEDQGMMAVIEVVKPVRIAGAQLDPAEIAIEAGTTVAWTNLDPAPITLAADNGAFNSGLLQHGLLALQENRPRTETFGYNVRLMQVQVFCLAGGVAALSGLLYASWGSYIDPSSMGLTAAITPVIYVAIGGRRSLTAAMISSMILLKLSQSLASTAPEYALVIFGVVALLAVLFVPEGFMVAIFNALDRWVFRRAPVDTGDGAASATQVSG